MNVWAHNCFTFLEIRLDVHRQKIKGIPVVRYVVCKRSLDLVEDVVAEVIQKMFPQMVNLRCVDDLLLCSNYNLTTKFVSFALMKMLFDVPWKISQPSTSETGTALPHVHIILCQISSSLKRWDQQKNYLFKSFGSWSHDFLYIGCFAYNINNFFLLSVGMMVQHARTWCLDFSEEQPISVHEGPNSFQHLVPFGMPK